MFNTDNISPEKLAAQVLFPKFETERYIEDEKYQDRIHNLIEKGVGGFCVFNGNTENLPAILQSLQARAEVPLLFCADFEYGLPMRLDDGTEFPHAMALGRSDAQNTFNASKAIANETSSLGIKWNLAPVADINSNKSNPVINIRSFGEEPELVANHSIEYMRGTQSENILACAKHFPGHGDTNVDSHLDLPVLAHTKEKIYEFEFEPFRKLIANGVKSVMIGHLAVPSLDSTGLPASLSKVIITDILKNELGFRGLVLTDAMDMNSISKKYSAAEACVMAIEAGNDIVLMPDNDEEALDGLVEKAINDENFKNLLSLAYSKIYKEKRWCKLIPQFATLESTKNVFIENQKIALKIAHKAIEKVGDTTLLPLNEKVNFAGFAFVKHSDNFRAASRFFTMLSQATENDCDLAFVDTNITDEQIEEYAEGIVDSEIVLFCIFNKGRAYQDGIALEERINNVIEKLSHGKKVITLLFGNPYIKDEIKSDLHLLTYSDSFASLAAAVVELSGRFQALKL